MRRFSTLDDLTAAVGDHLGHSDWLQIDQDRIDAFADATGDHQWIHVDPERAASGPFGATIAHGYLSMSLLPLLVAQIVDYDGWATRINYGTDKVRFPSPVVVGSRIRAGAEVTAVDPGSAGTRVSLRVTVEIEDAPKPAVVADTLTLLIP